MQEMGGKRVRSSLPAQKDTLRHRFCSPARVAPLQQLGAQSRSCTWTVRMPAADDSVPACALRKLLCVGKGSERKALNMTLYHKKKRSALVEKLLRKQEESEGVRTFL